ncbi:MAG TPA: VOC family protein [Euzebya sp.]|nr:VOC family protein [Euzebya sp.]
MTTTAPQQTLTSGHVGINGDQRYAFLGSGGTLLVTLWEQSQGVFDAGLPGLHHLALQVPDAEAVTAAQQRLRDAGATFLHDGVRAHAEGGDSGGIWFTDPDGTRLEVYTSAGLTGVASATPGAPTCGFF